MPRHQVSEILPYSPQQLYDLVVDMDNYPKFLPWCVKARKYDETATQFMAEMTVSFKGIRETFRTVDRVFPPNKIQISLDSGPFDHLDNVWEFTPTANGTRVEFTIDFQFKSRVLNLTLGPLFSKVTQRMVAAFRDRAITVYGSIVP
ncbi:MAG: type II toxin-antitoxin system RatA family toxin [Magnetococcales bacterium]|nr:type II toxin-antitoxin system RatA family toxin [Magnetococcales bacterium]